MACWRKRFIAVVALLLAPLWAGPGRSAAEPMNLLANPGFESLSADLPDRWDRFVQPKPGAAARVDDTAHGGDYAVWLHTPTPYDREPVNNWSQNIIAEFGGQTLRVSGFIKVTEAKEAAIWLQCWRKQPWGVLAAASTSTDAPVYGTKDWQEVSMDVPVPDGTDFVTVRCVLLGAGSAWFDDLSVTRISGSDNEKQDEKPATMAPPEAASEKAAAPVEAPEAVAPSSDDTESLATIQKNEAQQEAVMPLVNQLEAEVRRLREANLLLTDTLQQIQQVNQGLVNEMIAVQTELQELKDDKTEAAAPSLEASAPSVPPLVPLSEAAEYEAP